MKRSLTWWLVSAALMSACTAGGDVTQGASTETAPPPTPQETMANTSPPSPAPTTYTIGPGDTWSSIAETVYGDPTQFQPLIDANGGERFMPYGPGDVITVPPAE
jgi:nucleoid-associated protein YgaU